MRRQLIFGLYRNYDFSALCLIDLINVCTATKMSGVLIILHEISVLFQKTSQIEVSEGGLDLRWTITAIMGELIEWSKNHADDQRFVQFVEMIQAI